MLIKSLTKDVEVTFSYSPLGVIVDQASRNREKGSKSFEITSKSTSNQQLILS